MNRGIYQVASDSIINDTRYSNIKRNDVYKLKLTNSGVVKDSLYFNNTRNLIDNKPDLLMYMDKDVEELFLSTGLNDKYTR